MGFVVCGLARWLGWFVVFGMFDFALFCLGVWWVEWWLGLDYLFVGDA